MTDLTDLCAAALVATQHAFDEQDDELLWAIAVSGWTKAMDVANLSSATVMQRSMSAACRHAVDACADASWCTSKKCVRADDSYRHALTAAKVAMMWID
jgi:hypothetical protein